MSISQPESRPLISITELFNSDPEWVVKRDKAIKKLYDGNTQEFNAFISKLEPMRDWKDVMDAVEAEFMRKKIRQDSKEATGLTDVLFKRYFPSY